MNRDLSAIEGQLEAPFDMPKQWRTWVTRFLMQVAVDPEAALAQRFKAVELLLRIDAINKAAIGVDAEDQASETLSAVDELSAVRSHLLPLKLASEDDTTEEIARRAVAEIIQLRRRLPAT